MKIPFKLILILCLTNTVFGVAMAQTYPYQDSSLPIETRVDDLLSRMTLDEKIGQMTQPQFSTSPWNISTYFIGSVLSGGDDTAPGSNTAADWANLYDSLQQQAMATRLGIPIIFGIDAVHGHNKIRNAVVFPHNIGMGAANDPELMERVGAVTAKEVKATGLNWTFGPCLAVVRDERWGRTYEGFAEDPVVHNNLVASYIRGFQGTDTNMQGEKIVACAKHYIGDGGTTGGINAGNTVCTEAFLRAVYLPPYQRALEAGVGTVMTSFSSWNGEKCVTNKWLLTDLLKNELGFDGFVISDWEDIGSDSSNIRNAINAGVDMSMAPTSWKSFIANLKSSVSGGYVPQSRIDDAVKRILRIKFKAGLFEHPYTDRSLTPLLGSPAHRAVAREAVRKSLVLLKNENNILPIAKNADIFVAGSSANSLTRQCGGWTIMWQGMPSESSTGGFTILKGIQNLSTGSVTFSADGSGAVGHGVAIVVVGEKPYAESAGDSGDLHLSATDIATINTVRDSGTPYVVVLVSGRPMIITDQIADADAFVAAWLPGTEGQGVADVLFGNYNFTGKLSYSWPRDMSQIPINVGDDDYNPLFPYGYGLSYEHIDNNEQFVIDSGIDLAGVQCGSVAWGDYNNDGHLDLAVCGMAGTTNITTIYRNNGDGTFTDIGAGLAGVYNGSLAWGDYNNDGHLDLAVCGMAGTTNITTIYRNNGDGTFTDINAGLTGVRYGSVAWGDYNNDGHLDLAVCGMVGTTNITKIYRNNGNGTFTDVGAGLTGVSRGSLVWGDYNNDGHLDLAVCGMVGTTTSITTIYRNNGDNTFTDIGAGLPGVFLSSLAWGDYNNDGYLDLAVCGYTGSGMITKIYRNNGDGTFTDIGAGLPGVRFGSLAWGDYDNDGNLDLAVCGSGSSGSITKIYRNNSNGTFTDIGAGLIGAYYGSLAWSDYNKDGYLDLALCGSSDEGLITGIYKNKANPNGLSPLLTIAFLGTHSAVISWPSPSAGYVLQQNPDLTTTNWSNFSGTVNDDGVNKRVTNNPSTNHMFFRLVFP
jgi:beta-glucosidase